MKIIKRYVKVNDACEEILRIASEIVERYNNSEKTNEDRLFTYDEMLSFFKSHVYDICDFLEASTQEWTPTGKGHLVISGKVLRIEEDL